ncbi:hypothetical protein ACJZ2D_004671 [Fusarium nematophilum]
MVLSVRLLNISRGYATRPGGPRLKQTLSLDQFIQRARVLSLYRTILRGTKRIADPVTRAESRKYARDEFERHRNVTDVPNSLAQITLIASIRVASHLAVFASLLHRTVDLHASSLLHQSATEGSRDRRAGRAGEEGRNGSH